MSLHDSRPVRRDPLTWMVDLMCRGINVRDIQDDDLPRRRNPEDAIITIVCMVMLLVTLFVIFAAYVGWVE